jgi:hypothetical protein
MPLKRTNPPLQKRCTGIKCRCGHCGRKCCSWLYRKPYTTFTTSSTSSPETLLRTVRPWCDCQAQETRRAWVYQNKIVSSLVSQVANTAALATTREVVNNTDRITKILTQIQGGAGSLVSQPVVRRSPDELSLLINLTERASINPTEA